MAKKLYLSISKSRNEEVKKERFILLNEIVRLEFASKILY